MARPKKTNGPPKQGPPIAFRAGPDLAQVVSGFAEGQQVGIHEAFKNLAALAVVGFDVRYYDLVAELAAGMSGFNPFVRAVLQIHAALSAAARVEPRYGRDPDRTRFVIDTVRVQVAGSGRVLRPETVQSLLVRLGKQDAASGGETGSEELAGVTAAEADDPAGGQEKIDRTVRKKKTIRFGVAE